MPPIRVLISAEVLANTMTGVEHYTLELIKALSQRAEVEVTILCQTRPPEVLADYQVRTIVEPSRLGRGVWGYWLRPPRCLSEFDIVHCPTVRTPFLKAPAGPKLVMTVHDLVPLVTPENFGLAYRVYFKHVLPRLLRQCDGLITVSRATANDLQSWFPETCQQDVTVVYNGPRWQISPSQLSLPTDSQANLAAHHHAQVQTPEALAQASETEPFFLAVGTLEPRKNLRRVIEAFVQFKKQLPGGNHRLKIAGRVGWGVSDLKPLLQQHAGVVDFLGYTSEEDLQRLYTQALGLVYPSLYEGFGLPVLEALSFGCPVITSNRSSLPEVAGDAALYVDPEQTPAIAQQMLQLATQPLLQAELSQKGLLQAAQFSWARCAEQVVEVYRRVLATTSDQALGSNPDPNLGPSLGKPKKLSTSR